VRDPKNKSRSVVLDVLEDKLHRSSPSHEPLRQQHNSNVFNRADRL
jgi:hypothetical protein